MTNVIVKPPLELTAELICDECGQTGALVMGDAAWCPDCYAAVSSSCAGGG